MATKKYYVVIINGDPSDSHAALDLERALEMASPDKGSKVQVYTTRAKDPGAARLFKFHGKKGKLVKSFTKGGKENGNGSRWPTRLYNYGYRVQVRRKSDGEAIAEVQLNPGESWEELYVPSRYRYGSDDEVFQSIDEGAGMGKGRDI